MYQTLFFSLKVSDMLLSFHSPLNLCTPLTGESTGGVSSTSACIVSNRDDAIDAGRNGETSECSTLSIPSKYDLHCFRQFDRKEQHAPSMDTACKSINHSSKDVAHESLVTTDSCTATTQSGPFDSHNTTTSSGSVRSTKFTIMPGSVRSRASGTPFAGIDRMMLLREDALLSSESFIYQKMSIFEKMEKKIQGRFLFVYLFVFLFYFFIYLFIHLFIFL